MINHLNLNDEDAKHQWLHYITPHPRIVGSTPGQDYYLDPRRVIYDHELLMFGEGGQFEVVFEDQRFELTDNSFIIIPPGLWHVSRGIESAGVMRAWVHFDWQYDPRPVPQLDLTYAPAEPEINLYHHAPDIIPKQIIHGKIPNPINAFALHQRIKERFNGGKRAQSSRALVLELLLDLFSEEEQGDLQSGYATGASDIREALNRFAQIPFADAPPIREYLARRGQSYDHQARTFKKSYGVTPLQFVNALRIEQACNLLRDTSLKVGSIAERLGYSDLVYFGRSFKKYTGKTPQAYRKSEVMSV